MIQALISVLFVSLFFFLALLAFLYKSGLYRFFTDIPDEIVKLVGFFFMVWVTLTAVTYTDYLVMGVLFEAGFSLPFWFCQLWWLSTGILFGAIAILVGSTYMAFREKSERHLATAIILGLTVFWQEISGNLDMMWFLMDAIIHGKPWINWDTIWVWNPFYWHFHINWTTRHEVAACILMNGLLIGLWFLYAKFKFNKKV